MFALPKPRVGCVRFSRRDYNGRMGHPRKRSSGDIPNQIEEHFSLIYSLIDFGIIWQRANVRTERDRGAVCQEYRSPQNNGKGKTMPPPRKSARKMRTWETFYRLLDTNHWAKGRSIHRRQERRQKRSKREGSPILVRPRRSKLELFEPSS